MPMIVRYSIMDEIGRVLTIAGFFSYDEDDALEFVSEDDAIEVSDQHPGTTVERYRRWSNRPEVFGHNAAARLEQAFKEAAE